jgi:hypothetical protein
MVRFMVLPFLFDADNLARAVGGLVFLRFQSPAPMPMGTEEVSPGTDTQANQKLFVGREHNIASKRKIPFNDCEFRAWRQ